MDGQSTDDRGLGIASADDVQWRRRLSGRGLALVFAVIRRPRQPPWRAAVMWALVVGAAQAATPLVFWWLDASAVYALGLAVIASVYVGFAVADGRGVVLAVETVVAAIFVVVAAVAVTGSPWLLVIGLAGHGLKDLWQHRRRFVSNTRWWPPFCLVIDWMVAAIIAVEIVAGAGFHQ